jgi:hypothetical protein
VLRIDRLDGSIFATFFHYACHATALDGQRGLISPDYPGVARALIDATLDGTSLYLPGCGGDLRPPVDTTDLDLAHAQARLDRYGGVLGREVCRVAESIETRASSVLQAARAEISVPFADPLPIDQLRELANAPGDLDGLLKPWARRVLTLIETGSMPRARLAEMQAISIGPLTFVGIPGEPLQDVGRLLEDGVRRPAETLTVWPIGYANDLIGYFCTREQYAEGGYEPTAYVFYDEPAPFRGEERVIVETALDLLRDRAAVRPEQEEKGIREEQRLDV